MRKLILFIILVFITIGVNAQSYQGYQGKKFSFSYQPSYVVLNYFSTKLLAPQTINFTYSPFQHFSIGLSATSANKEFFNDYHYKYMHVNDKTIGIAFNYHRKNKGSYSPAGRYIGLKFEYGTQNGETLQQEEVEVPNCVNCFENLYYYDERGKGKMIVASVIFGRNFILKDHFLLGYGIQWGLIVNDNNNQPMRHMGRPFFNLGIIF
ncbi:hypothetical protein [Brumimicrobium mesophilum]|uniref:hypothetical protein n=1 Tax=Brumimicrobium mesophilum TaxID=392717 RepID=UPI000D14265F|nr:hypothetical protein [Brumimicrobium mesophilum]